MLSGLLHSDGQAQRYRDRAARRVHEVCADATSTAEVIDRLREPFNTALGFSGMLLSATDPDTTTLGTSTVVEHLPEEIAPGWMHNEFRVEDFNKFATLHRTSHTGSALDCARRSWPTTPKMRKSAPA